MNLAVPGREEGEGESMGDSRAATSETLARAREARERVAPPADRWRTSRVCGDGEKEIEIVTWHLYYDVTW